MKRNKKRVLIAVLAICALAAGGAAFTANITNLNGGVANVGYGAETVQGATSDGVHYALDANGSHVTAVDVYLTAPTSGPAYDNTNYQYVGSLELAGGGTAAGTCAINASPSPAVPNTGDADVTCSFSTPVAVAGATGVTGFQLSVSDANATY